jgi:hypothetical protein
MRSFLIDIKQQKDSINTELHLGKSEKIPLFYGNVLLGEVYEEEKKSH